MKMRNYLKRKQERVELDALAEEILSPETSKKPRNRKILAFAVLLLGFLAISFVCYDKKPEVVADVNSTIKLDTATVSAATVKRGTISIPVGITKANPFMPYRDISGSNGLDIPVNSLIDPPESLQMDSEAARVMDTIVSGILYDTFSPSAILNIEGNDYLVKKDDVVNNYKVLDITQSSVTVKLGANVYKAGIGEILTEGTLNHNDVSNLSNKFGGER